MHFGSLSAASHTLTCLTCKPLCVACGIRKPLSSFEDTGASDRFSIRDDGSQRRPTSANSRSVNSSQEECSRVCDGCRAKENVARTNVFYRYPILKYKSCPFDVEEYREELQEEAGEEVRVDNKPTRHGR